MATDTGYEAKEISIKELSADILQQLGLIWGRLRDSFDKEAKEIGCASQPIIPNILDEVIQNLTQSRQSLIEMRDFLDSEVIRKVG